MDTGEAGPGTATAPTASRPAARPPARTDRGWSARASTAATIVLAVSAVMAVVVAIAFGSDAGKSIAGKSTGVSGLVPVAKAKPAPELTGVDTWLNSAPLTMRGLRGKVVLVDFWKYTCLNCRHEMPFIAKLNETYAQRGLAVVGVHSPEFEFEGVPANVARGVKELHVSWPVAEDPRRATWDAFQAQYWPSVYLVDRAGRLRYLAIGESDRSKTEDAIRTLLADGGDPGADRVVAPGSTSTDAALTAAGLTPELFLAGPRATKTLPGGIVGNGATVDRADSGDDRDRVYLHGRFTGTTDWVGAAAPDARLDLRYNARDVYAIIERPAGSATADVEVLLDGGPVPADRRGPDLRVGQDGRTFVRLDTDDIGHLITGTALAEGRLTLVAHTAGVRFFVLKFRA